MASSPALGCPWGLSAAILLSTFSCLLMLLLGALMFPDPISGQRAALPHTHVSLSPQLEGSVNDMEEKVVSQNVLLMRRSN